VSPGKPLRVAYLLRYLPSPSETFVLDEAMALEAAGADVRLYVLDRVQRAVRHARHEPLYARSVTTPRPSSIRSIIATLSMEEHPAFAAVRATWSTAGRARDLRRVAWLARAWRRAGVDVIRVHHAAETARYAVAAATMADIPVSVAVHARDMFVPVEDFSWIVGSAELVTTITPFHRDRLLRSGLPSERVELVPCPVSVPEAIAEAPEPGAPLRVLAVGRLVPKKGHDLLMRACSELAGDGTPIELTIVGDGPEGLALRHLAGRLQQRCKGGLSIEMPGPMPIEQIEGLLVHGRFHVAALACREAPDRDRDGVPVTLLEARARGVPVVTTALPGFDHEFEDGVGAILVQPSEVEGRLEPGRARLTRALAEIYRDPEARAKLAGQARREAERRETPAEIGIRLFGLLSPLAIGPDRSASWTAR
jgi:glycosyltransferase involved in cell wall biosynthesis